MSQTRVERGVHLLRRGGRSILPVGAHFVPTSGPDWPWRVGPEAFERAFSAMAALGLDSVRIDLLWGAIEPESGRYDELHLAALDAIAASARRHGLLFHPALFIGGEVGDAVWDVSWRGDRPPHADAALVAGQAAHAAMLARRWRGDDNLLAWDLTDEPPFWLTRDTTDADARNWTDALVEAIRAEDPEVLITIGTASQEIGLGAFRADVVADALDFATVHPYPIYSPGLYPDALLGARMTHAAAFETALAAGAGRPVMVHEYGASSTQFDPERIAAYDRLLCWSALGRGAIGFLAWCWADAEPAATVRAPYVRQPHEVQFGVVDWQGELRPRGRVLAELAATVGAIDLDGCASLGPVVSAAIPIPHEYAHPYDPRSFGLDDAPAGIYRPAETAWNPERDVTPLIAATLNAYILAARAGCAVGFPRERLDGEWPDVPLVLLPAPLTSSTNTLLHVRTAFWAGAATHAARGGSLWISCSADSAIPGMRALAGCRILDRAPVAETATLRFLRPWGRFGPGDELALPPAAPGLATRGVKLGLSDAEVVAVDADGDPALVVARRGSGWVITCAQPLELLLASVPDAHGPTDVSWGVYAGLVALAGASDPAGVEHADITTGMLNGPTGALLAVTNHSSAAVGGHLRLPAGADDIRVIEPSGSVRPLDDPDDGARGSIELGPYGAAIVTWAQAAP